MTTRPAGYKVIQPYRREEVEDLFCMIADDPAWTDPKTIILRIGRVELERLLVTAMDNRR